LLIRKALKKLRANYKKALSLEYVLKPVSWALYQTWKEIDAEERPEKSAIDEIMERQKLETEYQTYLVEGLFADIDEAIDSGQPMSFEEFCKQKERDEQSGGPGSTPGISGLECFTNEELLAEINRRMTVKAG